MPVLGYEKRMIALGATSGADEQRVLLFRL
jgi:hypothetical protein